MTGKRSGSPSPFFIILKNADLAREIGVFANRLPLIVTVTA